jgi:uncharacterized protein (DUF1800 family)
MSINLLSPLPPSRWDFNAAAHLCQRAGFGGAPNEIEALQKLGLSGAVEHFLNPLADLTAPPSWANQETALRTQQERKAIQTAKKEATNPATKQMLAKQINQEIEHQFLDLEHWWIRRMIQTPAPLTEKMTLFWHGHFATSGEKVRNPYFMWMQNETFRQAALGHFTDLTKNISRDPAMLIWLDLQGSKKEHPNENFSRELMELFTLGEGHYTEADVKESARAFTGYRIDYSQATFRLIPKQFDASTKTFLNKTGPWNGDQIIDVISKQPQCARFIAEKLWRYFGSMESSPALIDTLGDNLYKNSYEIKPFLKTLFSSEIFYSALVQKNQIKSPIQFIVELSRTLGCQLPPPPILRSTLSSLGQVPFFPPNVKGWDAGYSWINTATLQYRYRFSQQWIDGISQNKPAPSTASHNRSISVDDYLTAITHTATNPENSATPDVMLKKTGLPQTPPAWKIQLTPPLQIKSILTDSDRQHLGQMVEKLSKRIFQSNPDPEMIRILTVAAQKYPLPLNDHAIHKLITLMMSTPEYQLC